MSFYIISQRNDPAQVALVQLHRPDIISYHIILHHITSYYIILYHITLQPNDPVQFQPSSVTSIVNVSSSSGSIHFDIAHVMFNHTRSYRIA
jgi:hypothetical protein